MNRDKRDELEYTGRDRLVTILVCLLVGLIFFFYLYTTKARIDEYAGYTLRNQMDISTVSVDARLSDAKRSITAVAGEMAGRWSESPDFDIVGLVDSLKDSYDFDVLEFVDKNGINLMSGANRFDASDREYYKNGIKGITGLWVNYTPKESKEFLLDYYAPVYFKSEIVGVMVGALGSKNSLEPITQSSYFGRDSIGVIFNEEERAIAASFGVDGEVYSRDIYDMFNLTEKDKTIFSEHVKNKDGEVFTYEGEKGKGLACVGKIDENGWGMAIIIPSVNFASVYGDFTGLEIMTLGAIAIIACIYVLYVLSVNIKRYGVKIRENKDIIDGFSTVYHTVFVLDYNLNSAICLKTRDPVSPKFAITEGAESTIGGGFMDYLSSKVINVDKAKVDSLKNLMYVKTMMDNKDFFSLEFSHVSGGKERIAMAKLQNNKEEDDERYLLGMSELE